ncbi:MAG TPA: hypothetical protein DCS93_16940 [Microscillaceae bacterium]|nr:hypothetical protein [Microscillaceae bacterium]
MDGFGYKCAKCPQILFAYPIHHLCLPMFQAMKVTVLENQYCSIYIDMELNLYEQYWHSASSDMEEEDYKEIHLKVRDHLVSHAYPLRGFFLDNRLNFFVISPELQAWHAENVSAKLEAALLNARELKVAIVVSEDFISQLSIEQTMEENATSGEVSRYFQDEYEAKEWLLS